VYLEFVRHCDSICRVHLDILLALVEQPKLCALVGVDDGEDLGDTLADVVNAGELGVGASGDLGSPELDQLAATRQYAIPPYVPDSSTYDLRSASWLARSSLDLFHSWAVFCSGCEYSIRRNGRCDRGRTYDFGLSRLWHHVSIHSYHKIYNSRFAAAALAMRSNCLTPPLIAPAKPRDKSSNSKSQKRASTYHLDCMLVGPGDVDGVSRVVYG
jgi:hypothetical protein